MFHLGRNCDLALNVQERQFAACSRVRKIPVNQAAKYDRNGMTFNCLWERVAYPGDPDDCCFGNIAHHRDPALKDHAGRPALPVTP
jgi:hypothetical protein